MPLKYIAPVAARLEDAESRLKELQVKIAERDTKITELIKENERLPLRACSPLNPPALTTPLRREASPGTPRPSFMRPTATSQKREAAARGREKETGTENGPNRIAGPVTVTIHDSTYI